MATVYHPTRDRDSRDRIVARVDADTITLKQLNRVSRAFTTSKPAANSRLPRIEHGSER